MNDPGRTPGNRDETARGQAGWPGTLKAPPPVVVVPEPVPAPVDEAKGKAVNPQALLDAIAGKRHDIAAQDEEIRILEKRVEQASAGEKAGPATSKDDDALRKAQEALARAGANRERTRTELEQMEKQEREAGK